MNITVSDGNIHIEDSYAVSKHDFSKAFDYVETNYPDNSVIKNRSRFTLSMEWTTHNALYNLNIARSRTKDVDLNHPQKWYVTAAYVICGLLTWLFIK